MLITHAGSIAHKVAKWWPTSVPIHPHSDLDHNSNQPAHITPGRIGTVFTCHNNVLEFLDGKEPGFFQNNPNHVSP